MSSNLYKELVFNDYLQKRGNNELSLNLTQPTPAKLKDECLRVCNSRYDEKDVKILEYFLKHSDIKDKDDCLKKIKKCEIAKFRPLVFYLKGRISKPDIGTIDLLAWLINFEPRPYEFGRDYSEEGVIEIKEVANGKVKENGLLNELEKVTEFFNVEKPEPEKIDDRKKENEEEKRSIFKQVSSNGEMAEDCPSDILKGNPDEQKAEDKDEVEIHDENKLQPLLALKAPFIESKVINKKKRTVLSVVVYFILFASLGYGIWIILKPQRYMYWTGVEYKKLVDSVNTKGGIVVAYDPEKLTNFKKVTDLRTINQSDIKHIWYAKFSIDDSLECFTGGGNHPVDTNRRLKPLTDHMYRTYILPLKAQP